MSDDVSAVHAFCLGTLRAGQPDDAAYDAVVTRFGRQGVLEIIALCGYYSLLAMVLNTSRAPLPDGTPPPLKVLSPLAPVG